MNTIIVALALLSATAGPPAPPAPVFDDWITLGTLGTEFTLAVHFGSLARGNTRGDTKSAAVFATTRVIQLSTGRTLLLDFYITLDDCNADRGQLVMIDLDDEHTPYDFSFSETGARAELAKFMCTWPRRY